MLPAQSCGAMVRERQQAPKWSPSPSPTPQRTPWASSWLRPALRAAGARLVHPEGAAKPRGGPQGATAAPPPPPPRSA